MAVSYAGTVGLNFNVTETNTDTSTGSASIVTSIETGISSLTLASTDNVIAMAGTIGTSAATIDLFALANVTAGSDTMKVVKGTQPITFVAMKSIVIHNKAATGTITVEPGASNPFLAATTKVIVDAGQAIQLVYPTAVTVSATVRNIKLTGSVSCAAEIYLLG